MPIPIEIKALGQIGESHAETGPVRTAWATLAFRFENIRTEISKLFAYLRSILFLL
jgi:hypothetical protein